jgi:hypothetical protein
LHLMKNAHVDIPLMTPERRAERLGGRSRLPVPTSSLSHSGCGLSFS